MAELQSSQDYDPAVLTAAALEASGGEGVGPGVKNVAPLLVPDESIVPAE